ncbi:MAG: ATP-binding protein [Deltaproteobacteria bacterium]
MRHLSTREVRWLIRFESWNDIAAGVKIGVTQEDVHLEFKAKVDISDKTTRPDVAREAARDICQFANGDGGVLLIGVAERSGRGSLGTAAGFCSVSNADELLAWFERTVRNYLSPSDLSFDSIRIDNPDDATTILAIHVPPYEGLAAVWRPGDEKHEYPWRTSLGKRYLNPMEAQERVGNQARAIEIRVRRLLTPLTTKPVMGTLASGILRQEAQTYFMGEQRYSGSDRWKPASRAKFRVEKMGRSEVTLVVENHHVAIPFGLIAEVWSQTDGSPGLLLVAPLAIPSDGTEAWVDIHRFVPR